MRLGPTSLDASFHILRDDIHALAVSSYGDLRTPVIEKLRAGVGLFQKILAIKNH